MKALLIQKVLFIITVIFLWQGYLSSSAIATPCSATYTGADFSITQYSNTKIAPFPDSYCYHIAQIDRVAGTEANSFLLQTKKSIEHLPTPGTFLLFASGLIGFFIIIRRTINIEPQKKHKKLQPHNSEGLFTAKTIFLKKWKHASLL